MLGGTKVKRVLGELPLTAELDWAIRGRRAPMDGFKLEELKAALPEWCRQVAASPKPRQKGKKVLVFATLHYWISHAILLSLALDGLGHEPTLAYLPYSTWKKSVSKFDLRRREAYVRSVFKPAQGLIGIQSFSIVPQPSRLPGPIENAVEQVAEMDTQYTLQVEEVDKTSDLFRLRLMRNRAAAAAALDWLQKQRPDVVILPNGLILEFGAVFHVARHLEIPVVSYEFGEQRDRIWLSRNTPVMLQETDALWSAKKNEAFAELQRNQVETLFTTRKEAGLFQNFYRQWQNLPAQGAEAVRSKLALDDRPVVLLAANVIGDSLTLGRAAFTGDMSTWLRRTMDYFAGHNDVQFVLRVHPGERNLEGPSVADLVDQQFANLPTHMRVVGAEDSVNTYDLVALADLGLVYTTTVGLEMAMSGLPVIVAGETHYRGKGFTTDPSNWEEYFSALDRDLANLQSAKLDQRQIDMAWHYAYRFFFDYPQPYPWHLLHFWKDAESTPLNQIFSEAGQAKYARTFDHLLGQPFEWD
ncbi:MAG TPA: hypothetical protein VI703_03940 [Anaerolineales bacterium]|nr:hypothetical protein [Anaerolineales bacterium]